VELDTEARNIQYETRRAAAKENESAINVLVDRISDLQ
jgi:hypothetical protein